MIYSLRFIFLVARMLIVVLSFRGISSVGRALAWHARGQRFEPAILHKFLLVDEVV